MILSGILRIDNIFRPSTDNFFNTLKVGDVLYVDIETSGPLQSMTLGYVGMLAAVHGETAESWIGPPKMFKDSMACFDVTEITPKRCNRCGSTALIHSHEPVCVNCNGRGMLTNPEDQ
jgi:hypothetical protein